MAGAGMEPRQRYLCVRLGETLGLEHRLIEDTVREDEVCWGNINRFLDADGVNKLVFLGDERRRSFRLLRDADFKQPLLQGENRLVYFLRVDSSKPVSVKEHELSQEIVEGVVEGSVLSQFEMLLRNVFVPVLQQKADWGELDSNETVEYLHEVSKFVHGLGDVLMVVSESIELPTPDDAVLKQVDPTPAGFQSAARKEAVVNHFEEFLADWCDIAGRVIDEADMRNENADAGPHTELEYWKERASKLTSVVEQKNDIAGRIILGVMNAARGLGRGSEVLAQWKKIDIDITDALNEAKDNVRFLTQLAKFLEPLYKGTPSSIIDALPALVNNLYIMQSVARYYNTKDRMTTLFKKITNQLVLNCKGCIESRGRNLWEHDIDELLQILESCCDLNLAYQEQFNIIREKLMAQPRGRSFELERVPIFEKFDRFCVRLRKLMDMFRTVKQFMTLIEHNIDGMERLTRVFTDEVDKMKNKRYNLVEDNSYFEKDYAEFQKQIELFENSLQVFINSSFENIRSTEDSLLLLKKFQSILQRENLKAGLDNKYMLIFHQYGQDLEQVQKTYDRHRTNPPVIRNAPKVAGKIIWARQLWRRIEEPMNKFKTNQAVMRAKDSEKIIRTYNRLGRALIEFEASYHAAWVDNVRSAKDGLLARLIVRHPVTGKMEVNFDNEILQLIRETKWLLRLGLEVPEDAKMVLLQEEKFKRYKNQLSFMVSEYDRVSSMIHDTVRPLLAAHLDELDQHILPGEVVLQWTSMNIDPYLMSVHTNLSKLEELLIKINHIVDNRMDANLRMVGDLMLVYLPRQEIFTLDKFVRFQESHVKKQTKLIQQKSVEVQRAVEDIIGLAEAFPLGSLAEGQPSVDKEGMLHFREHYCQMMFRAILLATTRSLHALKRRVLSANDPLFEVNVELQRPDYVMNPSLSDVQAAINHAAKIVINCSKHLAVWGFEQEEHLTEQNSFFAPLAQSPAIFKVILILKAGVHGLNEAVLAYLTKFHQYDYLWMEDKMEKYEEFTATEPSLEMFENKLKEYNDTERQIDAVEARKVIGSLSLKTEKLRDTLKREASLWKLQFAQRLHDQARDQLEMFTEYIKDTNKKLERDIVELEDLKFVMDTLQDIRAREATIDLEFSPVEETYLLLRNYDVRINKQEGYAVAELEPEWDKMTRRAREKEAYMCEIQGGFRVELISNVKEFEIEVEAFRNDFEENGPMVPGIEPEEAMERLKRFQRSFEDKNIKYKMYQAGEQLFGLPVKRYEALEKTERELSLLDNLYSLYLRVNKRINAYADMKWKYLVECFSEIKSEVERFHVECDSLNRALRSWQAYKDLRKKIEDFLELEPILEDLANSVVMRPRHWKEIMDVTGHTFELDEDIFTLADVLEADLLAHKDRIEELTLCARKEAEIEVKLKEIAEQWEHEIFVFGEFKNRGPLVLKGIETQELQEKLEEAQMRLNSMMSSRFVKPFRGEVALWVDRISSSYDTIERWLLVQSMWMYMEAVFSGGGDIAKSLPQESKRFSQIDKAWCKIMSKAFEVQKVVEFCYQNEQLNSLDYMRDMLEHVQHQLADYLEEKRNRFPRFYFVSDPVLLEILSQSSDPHAIQSHLTSVFDSIDRVVFDQRQHNEIVSMVSQEGEQVVLSDPVFTVGPVEDWLNVLEAAMMTTVKDIIRKCSVEACEPLDFDLLGFIGRYPAQVSLLGIQFRWTREAEEALYRARHTGDRKALPDARKRFEGLLVELTELTQDSQLSKLDRRNIETLITIQMHQRDVFDELYEDKQRLLKDPNKRVDVGPECFDWQKQLRFYWQEDIDECVVSITDQEFQYSYEYLGCKERLVITPLTDRCYVTLSQALGMYLGGAPAGPAGTGKTETVKDLGRALGKYVVVFNCSNQMDHHSMGKIFKGCAQSGAWADFDEFNRIDLDVLSVVAQQIQCVLTAIRHRQSSFTFTDGQHLRLRKETGFFITMNPGYQGRQELPENLKVLFRGVTMMVPDRRIIIKVKLAAAGFLDYEVLSHKFNTLYRLCDEQLSKQPHYDFGLRNILSVLRTAGAVRRDNPDKREDFLLQRTLKDMNMSKLVSDDGQLLTSLINDLFSMSRSERAEHPLVSETIKKVTLEMGLQVHDPIFEKVIQLYETSLVRHGIMVIGPAGTGKTMIYEVLLRALSLVERPHRAYRMNPKAITDKEMFGELDVSNDWTDGIFSALWRRANKNFKENVWIICDGPVDAIWIENLNTVLDDNKLLTLANGDRLAMAESVKMCFEVEDLRNASPATVSRAGQIYVSDSVLGWVPVFESELARSLQSASAAESEGFATLTSSECDVIKELFMTHMDMGLEYLRKHCQPVMEVVDVNKVMTTLHLMLQLIKRQHESGVEKVSPDMLGRLFFFSYMWSLGGLLELDNRIVFEKEFLVRIGAQFLPSVTTPGSSVFDFLVDEEVGDWEPWSSRIPLWEYPGDNNLNFATLFVPTLDSMRYEYLVNLLVEQGKHVLVVGNSGTAKSVTVEKLLRDMDAETMGHKKINFSSATTPRIFQNTVEALLEKKVSTTFVPKGNKDLVIFIDDLNMPEVNEWGDQVTNELVRQVIESKGVYNLDKQKRGELRNFERLQYIGAMSHPGGGKNDIPNRLKRHFSILNMTLPSNTSLDQIFGAVLRGRFNRRTSPEDVALVAEVMTETSIALWRAVQDKMLPTPSKFHYIFNLRDLSRLYQGMMQCPTATISTGAVLVALWKHECTRVFADRLNTVEDKKWFDKTLSVAIEEHFGSDLADQTSEPFYFVDFMRRDSEDVDGNPIAPEKVYEPASVPAVKARLQEFLRMYNARAANSKNPEERKGLDLVLFDSAVKHIVRISRTLRLPRGNALLVGVGGSGKQSLTRLASFISNYKIFQITLSKLYNITNLRDDISNLYRMCGRDGHKYTFILTDKDIKDESFLEYINMILTSGEIPGLFQPDEMDALIGEMAMIARNEYPDTYGQMDSYDAFYRLFIERVRANLHLVLCFSPVGPKFRDRARKFPGLISGCSMNWFFPWPRDALEDVATKFLTGFDMMCQPEARTELIHHMATVHGMMHDFSDQYFTKFRRRVYSTPRSYLSYLNSFKKVYAAKFEELGSLARKISGGLDQLRDAEAKIADLKVELRESEAKLQEQQTITESMLVDIKGKTAAAQKKREEVKSVTDALAEDFKLVEGIRAAAQEEVDKAMPILDRALKALDSITPEDIRTVKVYKNPPEFIKRIFDGVLILQRQPLHPVSWYQLNPDRVMIGDCFDIARSSLLNNLNFSKELETYPRDEIDDEMVELLMPYLDMPDFNERVAAQKAKEVAGLCTWVRSMAQYHEVVKVVEPKLQALREAEDNQRDAKAKLRVKEEELRSVEADLEEIERQFELAVRSKQELQQKADHLRRKMESANALISALSGERQSWIRQSAEFQDKIVKLVGDVSLATSFISYCGPYNSQFRQLLTSTFYRDLVQRGIRVTDGLNITQFLVDEREQGDWNLQGLPKDDHSTQNGLMVTMSSKWPLLVDPQGQGLHWLCNMEAPKHEFDKLLVTQFSDKDFKFKLEEACREGYALIIMNIGEEVDPYMDPLLDKEVHRVGNVVQVVMGDKEALEYNDSFRLYLTTKYSNPHYSPELSAKVTVIDFTVTQKGLEEQLLARVIQRERKELEQKREELLLEINQNKKKKQELEDDLLFSLSNSDKPLLENDELIDVLARTKKTQIEVEGNLAKAAETERSIDNTRNSYRDVAARGSVLYFLMVEMSLVNPMYQTSLSRFLTLFDKSMEEADDDALVDKRVHNIIDTLTRITYVFVSRGLFEEHKPLYSLLLACELNLHDEVITRNAFNILLKGGATLNADDVRRKPFEWIPNYAWLNAVQLSNSVPVFRELCDLIQRNEFNAWRLWYDSENPEAQKVPDLHERLSSFDRLLLVRSLREDRTMLAANDFILETPTLQRREYISGVVANLEEVYPESDCRTPIVYLLSAGSDPTGHIYNLGKRLKTHVEPMSMGRGQEKRARTLLQAAFENGSWLMLQNCHLGLSFMSQIEDIIGKQEHIHENFRLFITSERHDDFPIGLLQMSIKLTNEPPRGIKAGLERSFQWINQDMFDRVNRPEWRPLLYSLCFLHSMVQERRKFGALGWNIPYEFNQSDLEASESFLEKHLFSIGEDVKKRQPSYETLQFMICEIHYGGRITDEKDRRLFNAYGKRMFNEMVVHPQFEFFKGYSVPRPEIPGASSARVGGSSSLFAQQDSAEVKLAAFRECIQMLPDVESPEIFGLHANADLNFRMKESRAVLQTALDIQPKESSSSAGMTREEEVSAEAHEMLQKLPDNFQLERCREKVPYSEPLNIFLLQEIERLQQVLSLVRRTLVDLQLAIEGTIIMSSELQNALDCIFDGRIPANWLKVSWISTSLGTWFSSLLRRHEQLFNWVEHGRPTSYWLAGFFNPQGFLTAVRQEATRLHNQTAPANDRWTLDKVQLRTEVKRMERTDEKNEVTAPPPDGVYIHGLFLEGASWDKKNGCLQDPEPKKLFHALPVLWVTAESSSVKRNMRSFYTCPVYKVPARTYVHHVFDVLLGTGGAPPSFWVMRGVALLCTKD